ncbi:VWA domain-containing protein [Microbulbifer sp. YPW1]|uniref:VWA domain-containing protein n=1 Tax=Microbulbifer sp. YPW1 TaxID=2745199 RepID=UPI0015980693|nr:VWA domain-containing protein [Microbulbifer sp. YPW1]QKX17845.1 VWA domain-containing protein [Microbulbifer sp. YPW1]
MNALLADISQLHFLRPLWLLLLPLILCLWWWLRSDLHRDKDREAGIAPHLARALTVGEQHRRRLRPIDVTGLLLVLLAIGTAGPSWTRQPNPLMTKTAPLVVVLKVSDTMQKKDVPPTRLERAKQKVLDLLATRDGAPTALVAYAGSAHRVVPLTDDQALLKPYLEGLVPDVMPVPGDAPVVALKLAEQILQREQTPGSILFLLDSLAESDVAAMNERDSHNGLGFLLVAPGNLAGGALSRVRGAKVERVSADKRDITALNRYFDSAFRQALAQDENLQWEDRGWWLAWPAALLALLWFRRGCNLPQPSSTHLGAVALICLLTPLLSEKPLAQNTSANSPETKHSGLLSLLLTPDQQGQWFSLHRDYRRAAMAFEDPYHEGYALYQAGQFEDAANVLAPLDTPEAMFTRAMAMAKTGQYEGAIAGFQQVLQVDPEFPGAEKNLALTKKILAYMEESRGEEEEELQPANSEDDLETEEAPPEESQQQQTPEKQEAVSADQWMSTLDTGTSEYLKQRFAAEAAAGSEQNP